jgi:hypothetical protein
MECQDVGRQRWESEEADGHGSVWKPGDRCMLCSVILTEGFRAPTQKSHSGLELLSRSH